MRRCSESFRALKDLAAGRPLLLVLIPAKWQVDETTWRFRLQEQSLDPVEHEFGVTQRRLLALAKTLAVDAIDLTPALRDVPDWRAMWLPVDRHLSVDGCRTVARTLAPEVRRRIGQ